ncbi:zinc-binding dehydrogenase [Pollutimonas subterranea]|uniref:Zinc-binding dehydrogenase n=1 Tax=Pollutimonas subterranea TaxID=2045210 RepID=A0A2N4U5S0_9BURK|nr:zinc-binding dehydrogenase [Pollutimonas subterranea]
MTQFTAYRLHSAIQDALPQGRFETISIDDLSAGDVVIRIAYSSLNYKDALANAGIGKIIRSYPRIGGIDLAGYVVSSASPAFKEGDEVVVHGFSIGVDHDGGHAQYARVRSEWVMALPAGLSLLEACTLGAAGYTAGLALHWMEQCGLSPEQGDIAVTGATGGVASVAIDILTQRGYRVCAFSGKEGVKSYLERLGAAEVLPAPDTTTVPALAKAQWAGAVDSVGGSTLAWLLSATKPEGILTSFGNTGGAELPTTVFPFILRGVKLLGINANSPMSLRRTVWDKLSTIYRPAHLSDIAQLIEFPDLPKAMSAMLARATHGRTVIRMHS